MKDSKISIRCEKDVDYAFREICFFERIAYGDLLRILIETYKQSKKEAENEKSHVRVMPDRVGCSQIKIKKWGN